jgi:hypothetical protein
MNWKKPEKDSTKTSAQEWNSKAKPRENKGLACKNRKHPPSHPGTEETTGNELTTSEIRTKVARKGKKHQFEHKLCVFFLERQGN